MSIANLLSHCFSFDSIKWSVSHGTHCTYFFPLHWQWFILYLIRLLFFTKSLSHWLHSHGLSPECVLMWLISWLFSKISVRHWYHWCGLSPVCILACPIRLLLVAKHFCYTDYTYMASLQYVCFNGLRNRHSVRKPCHTRCIDKFSFFYGSVFEAMLCSSQYITFIFSKLATIIKNIFASFFLNISINL